MESRHLEAIRLDLRAQQFDHQRSINAAKTEFSRLTRQDLYALREALTYATTVFKPIYSHIATGGLEAFAQLSPENAARLHASVVRKDTPEIFRPVFRRITMNAMEAYAKLTPEDAAKYHSCVATIYKYRSKYGYDAFLYPETRLEAVISLLDEKSGEEKSSKK